MESERKETGGWNVETSRQGGVANIGFVGTYTPRRCGIATFGNDLVTAIAADNRDHRINVVAINDRPDVYGYPKEVKFEVSQNVLGQYRKAADFLNMNSLDAVCVQHEFGIFGGDDGGHILRFMKQLHMPVVVTLHTILRDPSDSQRELIQELAHASDRLVVMSQMGQRYLEDIYDVDGDRVVLIPHGIPDVAFVDPCFYKDQFGVEGKKVILTFGLLSPSKGIETMIRALPEIVRSHPDAIYVVLGATHPHVKREAGESYRRSLQQLAHELGVDDHVRFHDRYVDVSELCEWLSASDVYVTPYLNQEQITSGTLAYAMGTGNAVVSTPYWYAVEMLADGRGTIADFGDSEAFAGEISGLLADDFERHAMRKRAYAFTRQCVWSAVGRQYLNLFAQVTEERRKQPRHAFVSEAVNGRVPAVPEINLDHLRALTDDVGVLQHATYQVPDRGHGYCTDDNARSLITALKLRPHAEDVEYLDTVIVRYLAFLRHAFNLESGAFRNFMGYDRRWHERIGAPDANGRGVWAAGELARSARDSRLKAAGLALLHQALPHIGRVPDLRSQAASLLGLCAALSEFEGDRVLKQAQRLLTDKVFQPFLECAEDAEWCWPEEVLTYGNALLPHALIVSGAALDRQDVVDVGLNALRWLARIQHIDGHFVAVGNQGWYPRGGQRARFDQQPIEAAASVSAYVAAFRATGDKTWVDEAVRAYRWFLGYNDAGVSLYDGGTGGCRDGLGGAGANQNQGAESTLAWLSALADMHELQARGEIGLDGKTQQRELSLLTETTTRLAS